jgi:surfeit locus 1 family protein
LKPAQLAGLALALAVSAVCVRLGLWQIARWHEKQRLNAASAALLAAPLITLDVDPGPLDAVRGRRVAATGRFDERRQILLSLSAHDGAPGVEVVTPLVVADGAAAILVDRGWLYAADWITARPEDCPEPGLLRVVGLAVELPRAPAMRPGVPALRALRSDSIAVWSARGLEPDSLAPRFPYRLAGWMLRELPGPGVPGRPLRSPSRPLDEWTHVSYAAQWFLFAALALAGPLVLARTRRRSPGRGGSGARSVGDSDPGRRG